MSENGKGDSPRPIVVDQETYKKNWEQTFLEPASPDGICDACMEEEPNLRRMTLARTTNVISDTVDVWLCAECYTLADPEE